MKKEQVEYKVNLTSETELSEWSDEVVELLAETFIQGISTDELNCDDDGKNTN